MLEAHDANTESLRPIWAGKTHEALGEPHQPLFLNINMSVLGLSSGIQKPSLAVWRGHLNTLLHSTSLCGKLYTIVTLIHVGICKCLLTYPLWMLQGCGTCVIKQTTGLASSIGDNPKEYWFYSKVLQNRWLANSIRIISFLSMKMEIKLSVQFNCPQVFVFQNVKGVFQLQMLQAKALRRNMSQFV